MRRHWTEVQVTLRPLQKPRQIDVCDTGEDVATTLDEKLVAAGRLCRVGPGQDASTGERICASAANAARRRDHCQRRLGARAANGQTAGLFASGPRSVHARWLCLSVRRFLDLYA